jgi:hypothetical protein
MVVHACNPSPQEAKARRLGVQVQFVLHSETLSQKKKENVKHKIQWSKK